MRVVIKNIDLAPKGHIQVQRTFRVLVYFCDEKQPKKGTVTIEWQGQDQVLVWSKKDKSDGMTYSF